MIRSFGTLFVSTYSQTLNAQEFNFTEMNFTKQ
jgi:hypothetical protein